MTNADAPQCDGRPPWPARTRRHVAAALIATSCAAVLVGCAGVPDEALPQPRRAAPPVSRPGAVQAALAYHETIRAMSAAELARERPGSGGAGASPLAQIKQAMLLGHPQGSTNLARALALLEAIGASDKPEAVALQPLARLLAEQLHERQRLESTTERLAQLLERSAQQLKDAQKQSEQLQEKLDALTEIERTLPARPAAPSATPPAAEGRNAR